MFRGDRVIFRPWLWLNACLQKEQFYKMVALILKIIMEEAGRALLKIISVEAEVAIANSWAEK